MDEFSYLSVLLSIILGLAVTEILTGYRGLLQARQRVRLYWPSLLWSFVLLVIYAQTWWAMFGLRSYHNWNFAGFAVVLFHMIFLYMLAGLVLPEISPRETIDLRANYFAQHRWFSALAILTVVASLAKDLVLAGSLPNRTNVLFHAIYAGMALIGALTKREWFHKFFALMIAALFALYIVLLFGHLD
jgi:hypothetical protein